MTLIIAIHAIACLGLIGIILIQRGRGGGLVESFSGLDSIFGTKTSAFLTKLTTILATTFFFTCLILTFLSLQQSKSLMRNIKTKQPPAQINATSVTTEQLFNQTTTSTAETTIDQQSSTEQAVSGEQKLPVEQSISVQEKTASEQKPVSEAQPPGRQFPQPTKGELK